MMKKLITHLITIVGLSCLTMCESPEDTAVKSNESEQLELTFQRFGEPSITLDLSKLAGGQDAIAKLLDEEVLIGITDTNSPLHFLQITMLMNGHNGDFKTKTGIENGFRLTRDELDSGDFSVHYFSSPYDIPEIIVSGADYKEATRAIKDRLLSQIEGFYEVREGVAKK